MTELVENLEQAILIHVPQAQRENIIDNVQEKMKYKDTTIVKEFVKKIGKSSEDAATEMPLTKRTSPRKSKSK